MEKEKNCRIRAMTAEDLDSVAKIWLDTNVEVHSFIPSEYWKENLAPVKGMFLQAEMYVYEENREILGFIGLDQSYIAGIFVKKQHRSLGIGKALLDFVKEQNEELTLHAYQKNEKAVHFYKREGFRIQREMTDKDTREEEYLMEWSKGSGVEDHAQILLRAANLSDAPRLLEIYAPYVTDTAITFEYDVPAVEEFRERMERTLEKYPYIVAVRDGRIIGYAYASAFAERAAYGWSVELSIYVDMEERRSGAGRKLYDALETILKEMHILNVNACIACPKEEDEYLDRNSVQFHEHMGFRLAGEFHDSGYKFGCWYNMVWMEKMIGEHTDQPLPVLTFSQVKDKVTGRILAE